MGKKLFLISFSTVGKKHATKKEQKKKHAKKNFFYRTIFFHLLMKRKIIRMNYENNQPS
jgi:hypothetical protein